MKLVINEPVNMRTGLPNRLNEQDLVDKDDLLPLPTMNWAAAVDDDDCSDNKSTADDGNDLLLPPRIDWSKKP